MITPHLEKLIWEGKASSRTWSTGGGAVSRIPVPKNNFIVIHDILWNPIVDERLQQNNIDPIYTQLITYAARQAHCLLLYTAKTKQTFNFRDKLHMIASPNFAVDGSTYLTTSRPYNIPCYMVFDENVRVNILGIDNRPDTWINADYTTMPDSSDELNISEGYQTAGNPLALQTLRNFQFAFEGAGDSLVLPNLNQAPPPVAGAGDTNYQFIGKNSPGRALFNAQGFAASQISGIQTPLVTFQYVQISSNIPPEMRPALT